MEVDARSACAVGARSNEGNHRCKRGVERAGLDQCQADDIPRSANERELIQLSRSANGSGDRLAAGQRWLRRGTRRRQQVCDKYDGGDHAEHVEPWAAVAIDW
jgi:hypothetical protein